MIKISIIIPVYNSEKFLSQCLNSTINQTLKDIEVICVNDGSTDNSLNILNHFTSKDKRITVIDKVNEGTGVARNIALNQSKGEFIFFVDSDDWIDENTCETLYNIAIKNNLDLLQVRSLKRFSTDSVKTIEEEYIYLPSYKVVSGKEFSYYNYTSSYACGKLWNRQFLKEHNLVFTKHKRGEDQLVAFQGFLHAKRVLIIDYKCYNYRIHDLSTTSSKIDKSYTDDQYSIASEMLKIINEHSLWDYFGFSKRLIIILSRLNNNNSKKNNLDKEMVAKHKKFIQATIKLCKNNRRKSIRFTSHIERFYLTPPFIWRFFK